MSTIARPPGSDAAALRPAAELIRLRTALGRSASAWSGRDGVLVEDGRWLALSGTPYVDLNVALCHGPSGGRQLRPTVDAIDAAGVRAVVMVAGETIADVAQLVESGWVCVGNAPLMALDELPAASEVDVRQLVSSELPAARALLEDAYVLPAGAAKVALSECVTADLDGTAWGLFDGAELVSCTLAAVVDQVAAIWWMTTPRRLQRRGHGRRLLKGVLASCRAAGATKSVLYSSTAGQPLYTAMGYEVLETWQAWSRPRWVLALS